MEDKVDVKEEKEKSSVLLGILTFLIVVTSISLLFFAF